MEMAERFCKHRRAIDALELEERAAMAETTPDPQTTLRPKQTPGRRKPRYKHAEEGLPAMYVPHDTHASGEAFKALARQLAERP